MEWIDIVFRAEALDRKKHDYLSLYLCASTVSIIAVTVL